MTNHGSVSTTTLNKVLDCCRVTCGVKDHIFHACMMYENYLNYQHCYFLRIEMKYTNTKTNLLDVSGVLSAIIQNENTKITH